MKLLSHVQLLATPWTAAHQAPPSMGFSRQEYWSGVSLGSTMVDPAINLFLKMKSELEETKELVQAPNELSAWTFTPVR